MKLKLDANGAVVTEDNKPVYVSEDGKEIVFDYQATVGTIARINAENRGVRERAETAEARVKLFDGIEDPAAARKALTTMKNLDDKKLVDAGEVETIRAQAIKAVEDKYRPIVDERDGLRGQLFKEIVGGSFSRSKFITDKLAIPADLAEARFGAAFTIEDGKVVAKDQSGNRIYSRGRPGELANFDEAMETLVDGYQYRDSILKGSGASGGGASQGGGSSAGKTITRAQFDAMEPAAKITAVREATLID